MSDADADYVDPVVPLPAWLGPYWLTAAGLVGLTAAVVVKLTGGLMRATLLSLVVVASTAAAQVRGPETVTVPVGKLVALPLSVDADEATATVLGGDYFGGFREYTEAKDFRFQLLGYAPGSGYVVVSSTKAGKLQPLFVVRVVVGDGPKPPPPGPDPPPPTGTAKYVVVIEETAEAAAGRGALYSDPALLARLKTKGITLRRADKDVVDSKGQPPADVRRFLDESKGKPLPRMFVVDERGRTLFAGSLREDAADFLKLLEKYGG